MTDENKAPRCSATWELLSNSGTRMICQRARGHTGPHHVQAQSGRCLLFWRDEGRALDGLTLEDLIGIASGKLPGREAE